MSEKIECAICLKKDVFHGNCDVVMTLCGHAYCRKCIECWILIHPCCPIDRSAVTKEQLYTLCICGWTGEKENFKKHVSLYCPRYEQACPECQLKVARKDWDKHADSHFNNKNAKQQEHDTASTWVIESDI